MMASARMAFVPARPERDEGQAGFDKLSLNGISNSICSPFALSRL